MEKNGSGRNNNSEISIPPEHLFSDYVEMVYLVFVILVGVGINLHVFRRLMRERGRSLVSGRNRNKRTSSFLMLKINLNVSDLLILLILATGKLGWLASYEWVFGDFLCRLFNFLSMFSLYGSSNIVVCIALDRLRTVIRAKRVSLMKKRVGASTRPLQDTPAVVSFQKNLVTILVVAAWMLALVWSIPQLFVWSTYNVLKSYPGGWTQCTDIWSIEHYEALIDERHVPSNSLLMSDIAQNMYDISHLLLIFYGPVVLLIACYLNIAVRLRGYTTTGVGRKGIEGSELSNTRTYTDRPTYSGISRNSSIRHQINNSKVDSQVDGLGVGTTWIEAQSSPSPKNHQSRGSSSFTYRDTAQTSSSIDCKTNASGGGSSPMGGVGNAPHFPPAAWTPPPPPPPQTPRTRRNVRFTPDALTSHHIIVAAARRSLKRISSSRLRARWMSIRNAHRSGTAVMDEKSDFKHCQSSKLDTSATRRNDTATIEGLI